MAGWGTETFSDLNYENCMYSILCSTFQFLGKNAWTNIVDPDKTDFFCWIDNSHESI